MLFKYPSTSVFEVNIETSTFKILSNELHTHTYIIGHYNRSVRITAELFTQLTLCVLILDVSGETCSLKSTPNVKFFKSLPWQFYLLSKFLPVIC